MHSSHNAHFQLPVILVSRDGSYEGCYLSETPVELHALGGGVAALDQPRPPVHVHQALVVVVVDGGAEHAHVELLRAAVVHVLKRHDSKKHASESRATGRANYKATFCTCAAIKTNKQKKLSPFPYKIE